MSENDITYNNQIIEQTQKYILIVDDDRDILESMRDVFELETKYNIKTASNFNEAKDILNKVSPDIAFLDIKLGIHSGLDLIPVLKDQVPDIICAMMTAFRDINYAVNAIRKGANEFFIKPLEPEKVLSFTHTALREQENRRMQSRLNHCDTLTGLPGRTILDHHLSVTIASAARAKTTFAVLFIDLDHFKDVNDTLGHDAGDRVLKMVSENLTKHIREEEIISRLGGDEFVVVLKPGTNKKDSEKLSQRLIDSVSEIPLLKGQKKRVSASIGIALYPKDAADAITLIKHADKAMYEAKNSGKNRFQFFTS